MVPWCLQLACVSAVLSAVVLCCGAAAAGKAGGGRPLLIAHRSSIESLSSCLRSRLAAASDQHVCYCALLRRRELSGPFMDTARWRSKGGRSLEPRLGTCICYPCRGSPCELPEETLEGYRAALDHGIDFIELDAVGAVDHSAVRMLGMLGVTRGLGHSAAGLK